MFSNWFLTSFRILLFPFAMLYGIIVWVRNWLYDKGYLHSASFGLPIIGVGNLSVGGTGKSPMVEYLVTLLKDRYKIATLSRGYKRKTKGYALASEKTTAIDIGDEPMQFHLKFPDVPVAVGEERLVAIPQLLQDKPETETIILDDAFQHRAIKAGFNILLTDCSNLFTRDFYLPTGDLRDSRSSYKRADVIVVTKCRPEMSVREKEAVVYEIEPLPHQQMFFTQIVYEAPYHMVSRQQQTFTNDTEVVMVTGIASPEPLKNYLEQHFNIYHLMSYNDHHIFTIDDWREIVKKYEGLQSDKKVILTTEKDAVRLQKFEQEIGGIPFYVLPIKHQFLFNEEEAFNNTIIKFIQNFKKPVSKKYGS